MAYHQLQINASKGGNRSKWWFFFAILYLIVDYGRPQDILPIGFLRPGMIGAAILLVFLIRNGNIVQFLFKQSRMIWLFILLTSLYIPFAANNFFAYSTTKEMLIFMPFILSTIGCVKSVDRLKTMIFILVLLMVYISLYSILHAGMGSGSYFRDENDLSLFINMWIPFCYFLFPIERVKKRKAIYGFGLVVGLVANVISMSRGGFVGMVCITFVCWLFSSKKVLSIIIIIIAGLAIYFFAGDLYLNEMNTVTNINEGTAQARLQSWAAAWRMFLDHPWGVGGNNFQVLFPYYQSDWFQRGMWGRVSHSLWFTLLSELGFFGVLIYFSILFCNLKDIFFLRKVAIGNSPDFQYMYSLSSAFLASMAGYFGSGTFLSVLYYPHYWYLTGIIIAAAGIAKSLLDDHVLPVKEGSIS